MTELFTEQTAFETAVKGLFEQNGISFTEGNCTYRSEDGKKCAVGMLLPDEFYNTKYEHFAASKMFRENIGFNALFEDDLGRMDKFLVDMQSRLHDDYVHREDIDYRTWLIEQAHGFSIIYGLEVNFLFGLKPESYTMQTAFETAVAHLYWQGEISVEVVSGNENCLYRSESDLKCAIGHLIPDSIYEENFEDKTADFLLDTYPVVAKLFGVEKNTDEFDVIRTFLQEMQTDLHDDYEKNKQIDQNYREYLIELSMKMAKRFKLDASFLSDLTYKDV